MPREVTRIGGNKTMTQKTLKEKSSSLGRILASFNSSTAYLELSSSSPYCSPILKPLAVFPSVRRLDVPPRSSHGLQQKDHHTFNL